MQLASICAAHRDIMYACGLLTTYLVGALGHHAIHNQLANLIGLS
jgi:hypothetical protein